MTFDEKIQAIGKEFGATSVYKGEKTNAGEDMYLVYAGRTLIQSGTIDDLMERVTELSD